MTLYLILGVSISMKEAKDTNCLGVVVQGRHMKGCGPILRTHNNIFTYFKKPVTLNQ